MLEIIWRLPVIVLDVVQQRVMQSVENFIHGLVGTILTNQTCIVSSKKVGA